MTINFDDYPDLPDSQVADIKELETVEGFLIMHENCGGIGELDHEMNVIVCSKCDDVLFTSILEEEGDDA